MDRTLYLLLKKDRKDNGWQFREFSLLSLSARSCGVLQLVGPSADLSYVLLQLKAVLRVTSRCSRPLSASSSRRPDPTWTFGPLDAPLLVLTSTSSPRSLSRRTPDTMELA